MKQDFLREKMKSRVQYHYCICWASLNFPTFLAFGRISALKATSFGMGKSHLANIEFFRGAWNEVNLFWGKTKLHHTPINDFVFFHGGEQHLEKRKMMENRYVCFRCQMLASLLWLWWEESLDESLPLPKNSEQKHLKIGAFKTFLPFLFGMLSFSLRRPASWEGGSNKSLSPRKMSNISPLEAIFIESHTPAKNKKLLEFL